MNSAYCECRVSVYNDNRICQKCRRFVPLDRACESCGAELDVAGEPQCAVCISKYAWKAAEVARRLAR